MAADATPPPEEIIHHWSGDQSGERTGEVLYRFDGAVGDRHGYAMADAGDVDGDGTHDIIAGAPGGGLACTGDETAAGRAYVYSGATGDPLLTLTGETAGDHFGSAVAGAGDVTGDGHADLLVGAQCSDASGQDSGRAYIHSGANGSLVHRLEGDPTTVDLGWFFVATVGDVDGDHVPDIYAGDFDAGSDDSLRGRAFVFSGATGEKIYVMTGKHKGDGLSPGRGAGDVNGDGVPDIAVGSYTSSDDASFGGRIDVFSGADRSRLRTYTSSTEFQTLGFDAVGIGDVDGDGVPDLLASGAFLDDAVVLSGQPG